MFAWKMTRPVNLFALYSGLPLVGLGSFAVQTSIETGDDEAVHFAASPTAAKHSVHSCRGCGKGVFFSSDFGQSTQNCGQRECCGVSRIAPRDKNLEAFPYPEPQQPKCIATQKRVAHSYLLRRPPSLLARE